MVSTHRSRLDGDDRSRTCALRILATISLWAATVVMPARAMTEGPPGANVGDTPATFEGMALSVGVGPHTGNATFEYPFAVPPGRNGLQPDLKLVYSHLTRDTEVGFGWELPLGRIERVTRRGVPRYNETWDALQVILPDRRFELVRAGTGWAARVDDVHVSVTASPAPALRMVWPSGLVYTFGDTTQSRIVRGGAAPTTATIFAWYLTRIEDPNGNRIDIDYLQQVGGYAYPAKVSYGRNLTAGLAHSYEVTFGWVPRTTAAQQRISCTAGFCRTLYQTLGEVSVTRIGVGLVRRFVLRWTPSVVNHAPLLREITVVGSNGAVLERANGQPASTRFAYHEPTLKGWSGALPNQLDWSAHDYAPPVTYDEFNTKKLPWRDWKPEDPCTNRDFIDVNGDGRPDWVRSGPSYDQDTNPNWSVRLNQGRESAELFGPELAWPAPRKCLAWRQQAYWLHTDYANFGAVNAVLGSVECDRETDPAKKGRCSQTTQNGLVDLDGDGRPEYVDSTDQPAGETYWKVWFQNPDRPGFQTTWVAWPVPVPPASSAMAGRRYRLDFTEHSVAAYHFVDPSDVRSITVGDELPVTFYEAPADKSWLKLRQRTVQALVDLNADGRPDLVDAGLGASVPGAPWVKNYGGENKGQVRVYWNTGTGFASTHEVLLGGPPADTLRTTGSSPSGAARLSSTGSSGRPEQNVSVEMFDVNGDGLRDAVKALGDQRAQAQCLGPNKWHVWYGTGVSYPNTVVDVPQGQPPSFDGPHCWDSPHNEELREWSKKRTLVEVLDINADGLPDYLNATNFKGSTQATQICDCEEGDDPADCCYWDSPYTPLWRVWINTGTGLADGGLVFFPKSIRTNDLEPDDGGGDTTVIGVITETFDLDGNGYPDSVQTGNEGHLKINYRHPENLLPNVLVQVTNPLGGTTDIGYAVSTQFDTPEVDPDVDPSQYYHHLPFPFWVVQAITQTDPGAGESGRIRKRWEYRGGYFNPAERSVVGFRTVDQIRVIPDPARPGQLKDGPHEYAEFHQTLGREGRKRLEYVFVDDGYNGLLEHREFTWQLETRDESSGWRRYFPTLTTRLDVDASSNPGTQWDSKYCPRLPGCPSVLPEGSFRATRETFQYDACGNVTAAITADATEGHGTNNPAADVKLRRVDSTFTTAGTCDSSFRTCSGICDRVLTRQVSDPQCTGPSCSAVGLREEFKYERGNQSEAKRLGEGNPTIQRLFDGAGNLRAAVDARGIITTIDYDPERQMYPARWVLDAAGKQHATQREYHPLFGAVTKHTDAASAVTEYGYDVFGRLTAVAEPGQSLSPPTRKYTYVIDDTGGAFRTRVEAEFREPAWTLGGAYRKEVTFYDALGRRLRRQLHRTVAGDVRAVVLDAVEYDGSGQVVREFAPVALDQVWINFFAPIGGAPATTITRDEFFRELRRTAPDGTARTTDRKTAWVTKECDAVKTATPAKGQCIATERDALDRVRRTDQVLRADAAATRSEVRDYFPSGVLESMTVSAPGTPAAVTSYTYDALVRLKTTTDPSSGLWSYGYDPNDNRTLEDDPTPGRHLERTYDALNRETERTEWVLNVLGTPTERARTFFEYDGPIPFGTGRLYRVTRKQTDGTINNIGDYVTTRTGYDARGNRTGSTQRIAVGGTSRSYTTTRTYDAVGRLRTTTLPAPDGGEQLVYNYAPGGEVASVHSNRNAPYVTDVRYDEHGRATSLAYGNGVSDTFAYHTAEGRDGPGGAIRAGHADRLAHVTSYHAGRNETLRKLDYTAYTLNGQVTHVIDGLGGGVFQDAVYDDAARLVTWSAAGISARTYAYDGLGRLTAKEGKAYIYSAARPFQIQTYDGGAVTYDADGNLTTLPGKTFTYDAEGNLVTASDSQGQTHYRSDDGGVRRVKVGPSGQKTFFFEDFDAELTAGTIRRHIRLNGKVIATSSVPDGGLLQTARLTPADLGRMQGIAGAAAIALLAVCLAVPGRTRRGRRRIARRGPAVLAALLVVAQWPTWVWAQCVPPPPFPDTRIFYHLDHLDSALLLTNAAGQCLETTKFFPYGTADRRNCGGSPIGETQGQFAFTGHRNPESHGLAYFQARYYAPELAVFVSRDPAGQFPNPYSYADGDPLSMRDPDGRWFGALANAIFALNMALNLFEGATNAVGAATAPESGADADLLEEVDTAEAEPAPGDKTILQDSTQLAMRVPMPAWMQDMDPATQRAVMEMSIPGPGALGVARGISSRALGRALVGAGFSRAAGTEAHHIVGAAKAAAPARAALERFGIGLDEAVNGVFLPKVVHSPLHTGRYYTALNNVLSQATTRQEALEALDAIRQGLLSGSFP